MPDKRALIVDDSAAARAGLRHMLQGHGLAVDEAVSAEDALDYLRRHRPDVVFMDHMMPGMSGLDAVRIIKSDADLATVPVVMYTSRSGELYVGQARALGALDVLPKEVKPAELYRILRTLNLVAERREAATAAKSAAVAAPAAPASVHDTEGAALSAEAVERIGRSTAGALELGAHLTRQQEAFGIQFAALRQELLEHHRRLAEEARDAATGGARTTALPRRGGIGVWLPALLVILLLGLNAYWTYGLYRQSRPAPPRAGNTRPEARGTGNATPAPAAAGPKPVQTAPAAYGARDRKALLDAVQWALNRAGTFGYDRRALGDAQLEVLRGLVMRLRAADFRGTVLLTVSFGRFCLDRTAGGALRPAAGNTPVSACAEIGYARPHSADLASDQSLEFANFLSDSLLLHGSGIRVEVRAAPESDAEDPAQRTAVTAGEWNQIARMRNRVAYTLIARDTGGPRDGNPP